MIFEWLGYLTGAVWLGVWFVGKVPKDVWKKIGWWAVQWAAAVAVVVVSATIVVGGISAYQAVRDAVVEPRHELVRAQRQIEDMTYRIQELNWETSLLRDRIVYGETIPGGVFYITPDSTRTIEFIDKYFIYDTTGHWMSFKTAPGDGYGYTNMSEYVAGQDGDAYYWPDPDGDGYVNVIE